MKGKGGRATAACAAGVVLACASCTSHTGAAGPSSSPSLPLSSPVPTAPTGSGLSSPHPPVPVAGAPRRQVDVSRAAGTQSEVSVALDPSDPNVLVAGSNSTSEEGIRAYTSLDGGSSWSSSRAPAQPPATRYASDPAVAVDRAGREYYAFLARVARGGAHTAYRLFVATRPGPHGAWDTHRRPVAALLGATVDDKPAIAVDNRPSSPREGRVYLVWSHIYKSGEAPIVISHSTDGGLRWSRPHRVSGLADGGIGASVTVAPDGGLYVVWLGPNGTLFDIYGAVGAPGGEQFGPVRPVTSIDAAPSEECGGFNRIALPAQPGCTNPVPSAFLDEDSRPRRVHIVYADEGSDGALDVFSLALGGRLQALGGGRSKPRLVSPPSRLPSDQFLPVSALDDATGAAWVCYYDTRRDPARRQAVFSCSVSTNGGTSWSLPVPAASVSSDETQTTARHAALLREYGDYTGLVATGGLAHPMWTDSRRLTTLDASFSPYLEEIYTTMLHQRRVRRR